MPSFLSKVDKKYFEDIPLLSKALLVDSTAITEWMNEECLSASSRLNTSIAPRFGLTLSDLSNIFGVAVYSAEQTRGDEKIIRELADDLINNYKISLDKEKFTLFLSSISKNARNISEGKLDSKALERGAFTVYDFVISPVLKFRRSINTDPNGIDLISYNPPSKKVSAFLAEVTFNVKTDKKCFTFQITKEQVARFKKLIEIAEKEMVALERGFQEGDACSG